MMGYGPGYGYGYGNMMGGYGFGGLLMLLFGVLVITTIVLLVSWTVRASHGHGQGGQTASAQPYGAAAHDEAVVIARRRLASGEITSEQYGELMRTLSS